MSRFFDLLFSTLGIVILLPLLVPLIILLRMTGEGKIFYLQKRVGRFGCDFNIYKFATMLENSANMGSGTLTMKNDSRVLPIGRILRKTKINELPQLLNVLKGDMSIIGPRPLVPSGESNYSDEASKVIRSIRPGLTGLGSLILRDEESFYSHRDDAKEFYAHVISKYKQELEVWFVQNMSLRLYSSIFILTIFSIIYANLDIFKYLTGIPPMPKSMLDSRGMSKNI